jgi:hypothetical protein
MMFNFIKYYFVICVLLLAPAFAVDGFGHPGNGVGREFSHEEEDSILSELTDLLGEEASLPGAHIQPNTPSFSGPGASASGPCYNPTPVQPYPVQNYQVPPDQFRQNRVQLDQMPPSMRADLEEKADRQHILNLLVGAFGDGYQPQLQTNAAVACASQAEGLGQKRPNSYSNIMPPAKKACLKENNLEQVAYWRINPDKREPFSCAMKMERFCAR